MVQTNQVNQVIQKSQDEFRSQNNDNFQTNNYDPNPHYQSWDYNEYEINYNLLEIKQIQQQDGQLQLIDRDNTVIINELQCSIRPKWLPILLDLEIELQAIADKKAIFPIDFPNYITKRVIPLVDYFLNKLFTESKKLKVQCYFNEILLLIQNIVFKQWKQYPSICINLLKKIFPFQEPKFFDSHFNEMQFYQAINNFYTERKQAGINNQHQGKRRKSTQDPLQQIIYYPLEGEILSQFQKDKGTIHLSPLLRIQMNYFQKYGGIALLIDGINNFTIQNLEILELLNYFSIYFDRQIYSNYFFGIKDQLSVLYRKINEEDIKIASKDQVKKFNEALERALNPLFDIYTFNQFNFLGEIKEIVLKSELQIYLQCFRCHIFEKRIYGLQQICDKISSLVIMDYYQNKDLENTQKDILIQFLVKNKIFQELFGEKAHFELIKRSCPLIRFLYKNNQLHQNEIILIVKMGKGKHESWSNFLFKILNDLAEIMSESDLEAVLQEIQDYKVDMNILNFIKCMGRNQNFDKKQFQQKKETKENVLTELELEQETVQNIPNQKLTIKVYSEEQQQSESQYLINRNQDKKMIQQQQKQDICKRRILNNDDSIDTNCEEGEGIRGRIIEYLLTIANNDSNIDLSNQALKIALDLICYQFRFLRIKYLNQAFQKLLENDSQTDNHIQIITKILTSQYPIDNYNSQQELIKTIEQKYQFKMSLLAVIGKTKKRSYEKNKDYYTEQIDSLLKFYQFLYLLTENKIEAYHLKLLWQLLIENAFSQKEWDLFFRWIISQNKNAISIDALSVLFFDYLMKIDYNSFTLSMFDCLSYLIVYFNVQYKIFKTDMMDQFIITDSEILGLEILWKLFFTSKNKDIINKVQQFLLQLTNYKSQNQQIMNKIKQNYIEHIFENIHQQHITERCLELCIKLLEEVEGMKYLKQDSFEKENKNGQNILIIVDNKCKNAQNPKRQEILVPENQKIIIIKQIIGQKLIPQMKKGDFDLVCRGNWLDNQKTLKDYKFDKKPTFQVVLMRHHQGGDFHKNDDNKPLALCAGDCGDQMNDINLQQQRQKQAKVIPVGLPYQNQLTSQQQESIQNVMDITNQVDKDFVEFVLKENNWNGEQAIMDIIENQDFYWQKYEDKQIKQSGFPLIDKSNQFKQINDNSSSNPQQPQFIEMKQIQSNDNQQQFIDKFNIATLISENNIYIQKLFDTLNEGNENQNTKVWQILSMIPRNKETYELIEKCQQTEDWEQLLDLSNKYKLYYNLQILKELLDCDFIDDTEELKRRESCRDNFLIQGGLIQILQLFFLENVDPNTVQLALDIFLIYFTAFIQSKLEINDEFCSRIINLRDTVKNQFKLFEDKQTSNQFFTDNKFDKQKQKSDTTSNSQSSGVSTPKFIQSQITLPLTPPSEEQIPISKQQQLQLQQIENVDEKQQLIAKFKVNQLFQECMHCPYEDLLISLINKLEYGFEQIFQTILLILYFYPQSGNIIYEIQNFTTLCFNVLTKCQIQESRRFLTYSLIQICKLLQENEQGDFGIYLLKELLPKTMNPQTEYEDIFILTAVILKRVNYNKLPDIVDFSQMSLNIVQKIIDRPIIEERFEDNEDKVVQGYLILLAALIEICPQTKETLSPQMIKQIYEFLFHLDDDYEKYPKFKRILTRKRAFQFLLEASKNCEKNFLLLLDPISNTHGKFDQQEQDFDTGVKGHYGFVGLKNFGATCYINSLIQQFFMNKTFRHGILNSQIKILENNEQLIYDDSDQIKDQKIQLRLQDHTLYQLQLVFIQLQNSVKSYIHPMQFIKTLQGYDGLPINVQVQADVNEFFNLLTDKLEKDLIGTEQQELIPQIMGGILGHEIRSLEQDVEFQRETDEVFLTVTIEIKNKKNLEESLDLFIKADVLDGENKYFCEEINRRIDVEKRCYFKKLPNTFIFTLKRFEFDYNRMLKLKVNDYFEFPSEINMFKWTKDNLINNLQLDDYTDYIYRLVGVLVHTGSADSGHYYSYINTQDNKWFEFNDRLVQPFKFENLKQECFGGNNNQQNDNFNMYDWDTNKSKNAYLLFYEKIDKQEIQIKGTNEKLLQNKIIQENIDYLRNQLFYSTDYQAFVREFVCQFNFAEHQILQSEDINQIQIIENPQLKVVKLFTLFSLETLQKNKDQQEFTNSIQVLCTLYEKVPSASFWFLSHLQQNLPILIQNLIESNVLEIKSSFTKLLTLSIQTVINQEENIIQLDTKFEQQKFKIFEFLNFFIENLLPQCKKQMRKAAEFFLILKFSVQTSNIIIEYLIRKGFVSQIYYLFKTTITENSSYGNIMNLSKLNDKNLEATSSAMCEFLCKIILGSQTHGMLLSNEKSQTYLFPDKQITIQIDDKLLGDIRDQGDYKKVFAPMVQLNSIIVDMTKHLCFNDIQTSEIIIEQLVNILLDWNLNWQQIDPIFHIIEKLLKIQDAYGEMRFQALMETKISNTTFTKGKFISDAIEQQFCTDKNYSYCLSSWIAEICYNSIIAQEYFNGNKNIIDKIYNQLKRYKDNMYFLSFPVQKITKAIDQFAQIFYKEKQQEKFQESEEELIQQNNSFEGQQHQGKILKQKNLDDTSDESDENQAKIYCFDKEFSQNNEENKQQDNDYR